MLEVAKKAIFLGFHHFNNNSKSNGAILTLSNIMKILLSFSAKKKVGAWFHNSKSVETIRVTV